MEDSSPTSAGSFNWYIEKIIRNYDKDLSQKEIYELCNKMVEGCPPEKSRAIFVPYVFASASEAKAKGAFLNLSAEDDAQSLIRAIYEGVIFSSVRHVYNLRRPLDTYKSARLSGGITNSEVWSQMMADALGMPIQTLEGGQIGAKGAAIGAAVACGLFKDLQEGVERMVRLGRLYLPREEYTKIYRLKYENYIAAIEAVDLLAGKCR